MHRHQTQSKSADTVDTAAVIGSSKEFVESACKLVKQILGSLSAIAVGVTKLRNQNGTGHGRALPVSPSLLAHPSDATACSVSNGALIGEHAAVRC